MDQYRTGILYIDLLFNLLISIAFLFSLAFILINPISEEGKIDPPVLMIVELFWNDESFSDYDLHVRGPVGKPIAYFYKDNGYINLQRDDLGGSSDIYIVNGESRRIVKNYEIVSFSDLPDGEYVINVRLYNKSYTNPEGMDENVRVRITQLTPFSIIYEGNLEFTERGQMKTVVSFQMENNEVFDLNDNLQIIEGFLKSEPNPVHMP